MIIVVRCGIRLAVFYLINNLQNRAARIIMGYPNEHGCSEAALTALGGKTLKERRLESKAKLMYKIIHGFAPTALTQKIF